MRTQRVYESQYNMEATDFYAYFIDKRSDIYGIPNCTELTTHRVTAARTLQFIRTPALIIQKIQMPLALKSFIML